MTLVMMVAVDWQPMAMDMRVMMVAMDMHEMVAMDMHAMMVAMAMDMHCTCLWSMLRCEPHADGGGGYGCNHGYALRMAMLQMSMAAMDATLAMY